MYVFPPKYKLFKDSTYCFETSPIGLTNSNLKSIRSFLCIVGNAKEAVTTSIVNPNSID